MSKPYWINDYLVDLSRNQISFQGNNIAIPKKSLAVLTLLAESSGKVVSHDTLMDKVWTNSVVAPNTLQRSISQLRKAFGDDSKQQSVIKTHAKQGYSLEAKVKWVDNDILTKAAKSPKVSTAFAIAFTLLSLVMVTFFYFDSTTMPIIHITKVKPITATDTRETNARYSADGRHLVFHRYNNSAQHHLWAIDLTTQREYQLTAVPGNYGSHSWSADGNQLSFVVKKSPPKNLKNKGKCWQLLTLDFAKALQAPQSPVIRSTCEPKRMAVARWLSNGNIAVLHQGDNTAHSLQYYHLRDKRLTQLYLPKNSELYSYDFSLKTQHFATVSRDNNNQHFIDKLNVHGDVLSRATIKLDKDNSANEYYNIYFEPEGKYLLTSTHLGIFQLFFDGTMQKIDTLGHRNLTEPNLHPNGKKIIAIQDTGDQDITVIDLNDENDISASQAVSIARSNELDVAGKFQPNGHLIAYVSNRSGNPQIWLYDGNNSRQLTQLESGLQSMNFSWSPNGDEIATVSGDKVVIISLNGKTKTLQSSLLISKVMHWHSAEHLLVIANQTNSNKAFTLAINTKEKRATMDKELNFANMEWAQFTDNNEIVYMDSSQNIWLKNLQTKQSKAIKIEILANQVGNKILTLQNDLLYGINNKRQLWRYQLSNQDFTILKQLSLSARYISDFKNNKALITRTLRQNKEVIEFYSN